MIQDNENYDEAFELLADEVGLLDAKVMGVYGAMRRGLSKEEALKKYDLLFSSCVTQIAGDPVVDQSIEL